MSIAAVLKRQEAEAFPEALPGAVTRAERHTSLDGRASHGTVRRSAAIRSNIRASAAAQA